MSDRTLTAHDYPHGLSPLVRALSLENLLGRQRRVVLRLAQQLEDAELVRQVLERELARVREAAEPVAYEWPPKASGSPPGDTEGAPDSHPAPPGVPGAGLDTCAPGTAAAHEPQAAVRAEVVPGLAPGGVPTTPDPSAPNAGDTTRGRAHPAFRDETGKQYGMLLVVRRAPNALQGSAVWLCRCDCGAELLAHGGALRAGKKTRCNVCSGKAAPTCSHCGEAGHTSAGCPERPGTAKHRQTKLTPKRDDCPTCSSMSSRVEGPRCVDCGLEAERPPRATDFTSSGTSSLGRTIG